ncbi:MAG: hypothetical protein WA996_12960, partial [Candidatus Promineifilaceae bacterium]
MVQDCEHVNDGYRFDYDGRSALVDGDRIADAPYWYDGRYSTRHEPMLEFDSRNQDIWPYLASSSCDTYHVFPTDGCALQSMNKNTPSIYEF